MKWLVLVLISFPVFAQSTYSSMNQDSNPSVRHFDEYKDNTSGYIKQEQEEDKFNQNGEDRESSFDSDSYKKDESYTKSRKNAFDDL